MEAHPYLATSRHQAYSLYLLWPSTHVIEQNVLRPYSCWHDYNRFFIHADDTGGQKLDGSIAKGLVSPSVRLNIFEKSILLSFLCWHNRLTDCIPTASSFIGFSVVACNLSLTLF